jgi:hypothetical protein
LNGAPTFTVAAPVKFPISERGSGMAHLAAEALVNAYLKGPRAVSKPYQNG